MSNIKQKQFNIQQEGKVFREVSEKTNIHPCYNEEAHYKFARMHLPIAPRCNIQCNYCNRLSNCSNENRPGVSSEILTPVEAITKVKSVISKIPQITVVGIAGHGEPLANEETFETLKLLRQKFPDLILCLSTNGLLLPEKITLLQELKVTYLTITINAIEPAIGKNIYSEVYYDGKKYYGEEGFTLLSSQQLKGLKEAVKRKMVVKINTVMIPGINTHHIKTIAQVVKEIGASVMNIIPMLPVKKTKFANLTPPTIHERKKMQDECEAIIEQIRHCHLCRADSIGFLGEERCREFI